MDDILVRYTPPSRYDKAEYGKICKLVDDDKSIFYIQTSSDLEHPEWMRTADLMELVFKDFIKEPDFISACLGLLKGSSDSKIQNANTIISHIKSIFLS